MIYLVGCSRLVGFDFGAESVSVGHIFDDAKAAVDVVDSVRTRLQFSDSVVVSM